jgi:carboxymethylenebutenolidase
VCHDDDSRPPSPPVIGEVADHGRITLTAADGNRFAAYQAVPAEPNGRNVVIFPDVRGLHPYYEALAVRFAEAGFRAVAMDYFGRNRGVGDRGDDFDWKPAVDEVTPAWVEADSAAAAAHVRGLGDGPVFTLGFCFGGSQSWRQGASAQSWAGNIGFYGRPVLVEDVADEMRHPLLMLVAGADSTPLADFEALRDRVRGRGSEVEMVAYDGAPHSFFDRSFDEWADACADAWVRILDFTAAHS